MKTIEMKLSIGYPTATHEDEIQVEDDATAEKIDEEVKQWAWNYIDISWEEAGA